MHLALGRQADPQRLGFAVFLDAEAHLAFGTLAALSGLFPVLRLDFGGLERVVHFHHIATLRARHGDISHEHFGEGDLAELDLRSTSLAQRNLDFAQVLTGCAVLENGGVALVDRGHNVEVVKAHLARTCTTARGHGIGLGSTPAERLNISPTLVVRVFRFARGTFHAQ